jgi:hypothetical protein
VSTTGKRDLKADGIEVDENAKGTVTDDLRPSTTEFVQRRRTPGLPVKRTSPHFPSRPGLVRVLSGCK